ncbi:hypothetical protein ACFP1Z_12425 [Streptomyces gamaensis]|uniref:Uncharacterized protein n=1 Tax=Streptomyces gamaensis TaxID=1763542 RepID=A0ABW0YZ93_9ACTN
MKFDARPGRAHRLVEELRWACPAVATAVAVGLLAPAVGEVFPMKRSEALFISSPGVPGPPESCTGTEASACVYLLDRRPPEKVFAEGFAVRGSGANNNLLDHVTGRSGRQAAGELKGTTNFISVSTDPEYVRNYTGLLKNGRESWIYVVRPDSDFYGVRASLEHAVNSAAEGVPEAAEEALQWYGSQDEWVAHGGIRSDLVHAAVPLRTVDGLSEPDWARTAFNPGFRPGEAVSAATALYGISRVTEATAPAGGGTQEQDEPAHASRTAR